MRTESSCDAQSPSRKWILWPIKSTWSVWAAAAGRLACFSLSRHGSPPTLISKNQTIYDSFLHANSAITTAPPIRVYSFSSSFNHSWSFYTTLNKPTSVHTYTWLHHTAQYALNWESTRWMNLTAFAKHAKFQRLPSFPSLIISFSTTFG